jgi:cytosine deaminase
VASGPQPGSVLLAGGHLADGAPCDVAVHHGRVTWTGPADRLPAGSGALPRLDCAGYLLLTAPAEPHTHLDKALTGEAIGTPPGDLPAAAAAWSVWSASLTEDDVTTRARRALAELLAHGATAIRTHVNAASGIDPLLPLRAVVALRDELRALVDLQIVFLARADAPDALVREAVAGGADLVGGAPHMAPGPVAETPRLLRIAGELGVGVDLHTDEQLDARVATLADLADRVQRASFAGPVTASHCVSLGVQEAADRDRTVAAVRAAGIGVVALPQTNLGLQGRAWRTSPPRGLTAVRALLDAGVPVAGGTDNLRDPFNPVGRADPLEVASLLVSAGHLTVEEAWTAVAPAARQVMGLPAAGPYAGCVADLLVIRATSLGDAVARAPQDRIVLHQGRVVAHSTVLHDGPLAAYLS